MTDVRCLSIHASYRCRDSGACCSSGWPIPVEAPLYERLVASLDDGSLTVVQPAFAPFAPHRALPDGAAAVLGQTDDGRCVFHEAEARRCRIHRVHGHAALPVTCQQFPRMCVIDARGIQLTLSHYCPTAAGLLFEETPLAIVRNPPGFPPDFAYEGLDAREAFPPLLRPGALMDWETLDAFETHAIRTLDAETVSVDAALARLEALTERLREWRATSGPLRATLDAAVTALDPRAPEIHFNSDALDEILKRDAEVRGAVPPGGVIQGAAWPNPTPLDLTPPAFIEAHERWVSPAWTGFTRPLCRYLAAKLFANWCWYQAQGLRSLMRSLHAALAVLRVEAARQTRAHGRMLDRPLLREAFRRTDLLLIHFCSQEALARTWAAAERTPPRARVIANPHAGREHRK